MSQSQTSAGRQPLIHPDIDRLWRALVHVSRTVAAKHPELNERQLRDEALAWAGSDAWKQDEEFCWKGRVVVSQEMAAAITCPFPPEPTL